MKKVCAAILCAGLAASAMCRAADDNDKYLVWGIGATSCRAYIDARTTQGNQAKSYTSYLMGYLTAYNVLVPDTYNIGGDMHPDRMLLWLDGYCDDHQTGSFETAVHDLTVSLVNKRQKSAEDKPARWP